MNGAWWWRDHNDHALMYLGPYVDGCKANLNHIACFTALEWEMGNKNIYLLERRMPSDFSASWNMSLCLNIPLCSPFFKRAPLFIFNMFTYLFYIFWPHCTVCGILVPNQGSNPHLLHWKHGVLATGPPGKSLFLIVEAWMPSKQGCLEFWGPSICNYGEGPLLSKMETKIYFKLKRKWPSEHVVGFLPRSWTGPKHLQT